MNDTWDVDTSENRRKLPMKLAIVLGTRPEIIKMLPVIRACQDRSIPFTLIHTGQHYSFNMDRIFFSELELPEPDHMLEVGSGTHASQTALILQRIGAILEGSDITWVLVEGDTNTVLAGALAGVKIPGIKVAHVEAGLRSDDRSMPEEMNRIVCDHVSDLLFPPTESSRQRLLAEGIPDHRIVVSGNTIVDSVHICSDLSEERSTVVADLGLSRGDYLVATIHRQENVDDQERLAGILQGIDRVTSTEGIPLVLPAHPRLVKMMGTFGLTFPDTIRTIEPVGYLDFLQLQKHARCVLTDSGGLQEETCILGVPCVTLRDNTERPETLEVGSNILVGTDPATIHQRATEMIAAPRGWENPFGDGRAAHNLLDAIERHAEGGP